MDGQPLYFEKPDLSKAIKPPRSERAAINDLIAALSLFDPNPEVRERSIQDLGERAGRGFIDPADAKRFSDAAGAASAKVKAVAVARSTAETAPLQEAIKALDAVPTDRPADAVLALPGPAATKAAVLSLMKLQDDLKPLTDPIAAAASEAVKDALAAGRSYHDRLDQQQRTRDEMAKYLPALERQLKADGGGRYAAALRESKASLQVLLGDEPTRLAAAKALGDIGTSRAANILRRLTEAAYRAGTQIGRVISDESEVPSEHLRRSLTGQHSGVAGFGPFDRVRVDGHHQYGAW